MGEAENGLQALDGARPAAGCHAIEVCPFPANGGQVTDLWDTG